ncbi:adenosylcobinamide-GDP ribazoletransferase [Thalassospiraceae bacterium LMO-JJ14]|nr:adenosylcobinamide-GDP ribazoletransferase [Thalassospiraceae bacterium LMO-JJ14]
MSTADNSFSPVRDLRVCVLFLSRIPVGRISGLESTDLARAAWAFPLVGLIVGAISGGALYGIAGTGASPIACALAALALQAIVTGALHEDGLADVADGMGGRDREHTLEIMRDSRIGAYGVLALIFSVAIRAAMIAGIPGPGFACLSMIAAAMLSRGLLPAVMHALPPARRDGLSHGAGQPSLKIAAAAAAIGALALFTLLPLSVALAAVALGIVLGAAVLLWAQRKLGGQTGDVIGAVQQMIEIAVLSAAAAGSSVFYA